MQVGLAGRVEKPRKGVLGKLSGHGLGVSMERRRQNVILGRTKRMGDRKAGDLELSLSLRL